MEFTREALKALGVTDEHALDEIMAAHDALVTAHNTAIQTLQEQYDTDTAALRGQLESQAYDHAAEKFMEGYKFTSQAARKAALADFKAKGIKYADGKFEGAEAFMEEYRKTDPAAFAAGNPTGDPEGNSDTGAGKPFFSPIGGQGGSQGSANPFEGLFNFPAIH